MKHLLLTNLLSHGSFGRYHFLRPSIVMGMVRTGVRHRLRLTCMLLMGSVASTFSFSTWGNEPPPWTVAPPSNSTLAESPSPFDVEASSLDPGSRPPEITGDSANLPDRNETSASLEPDHQRVLTLLSSSQPELRQMGLRIAQDLPDRTVLVERLTLMADRDPNSVVQAQARLMLAELPIKPNSNPAISLATAPAASTAAAFPEEDTTSPRTAQSPSRAVVPLPSTVWFEDVSGSIAAGSQIIPAAASFIETSSSSDRGFASVAAVQQAQNDEGMIAPTPRAGSVIRLPDLPFSPDEDPSLVPPILDRPLAIPGDVAPPLDDLDSFEGMLLYPPEAPLGYTGPSGILSEDVQENSHFVPMPDRWRSGFPEWDRYGKGHPHDFDYPYALGRKWDPYRQNVLKGDYPFIGQNTFFRFTGTALTVQEYRQLPVPTTPFESTTNPNQEEFFGNPNQYFTTNFFSASFEIFHGSAAFKPVDWAIRLTPVFNMNYLNVQELGVVNPNVQNGRTRYDDFMALEEYFIEAKLADLSPDYDFVSMRVGSQPFNSDFRGFIFADINRAIRIFGTRLANRDEFNIILFDQVEKDTNSQLNTFNDRHQNTLIANYYRQDFVIPGYTAELSFHYNRDGPSMEYDTNGFLVRPDPAGVARQHRVDACYFGFAGEGHIGRINIANAFYWAVGRDTLNPIAGQEQDINARMAALELSYDRDWIRFRASYFYASGDNDPYDRQAKGFDTIFDNPNFAGGEFSFWNRQQIQLFGVSLVNRNSLVPDMRSSKFQGQSNFVNPGLHLFNLGMDFELTPKLRLITNANYLEFDRTAVLEAFTFQSGIDNTIGVDLSAGFEYRPFLNDNVLIEAGYAALLTGRGFDDLYGKTDPFTTANAANYKASTLHQAFVQMALTY